MSGVSPRPIQRYSYPAQMKPPKASPRAIQKTDQPSASFTETTCAFR